MILYKHMVNLPYDFAFFGHLQEGMQQRNMDVVSYIIDVQ